MMQDTQFDTTVAVEAKLHGEWLPRMQVYQQQPELPRALISLGESAAKTFDPKLVELVKLRASQLNGCAFCMRMHAEEARQLGEAQHRLDLLSAWRESQVFSARERAALHWTEALTKLITGPVTAEDIAKVRAQFSDKEIVDLSATIATINAWNRIAASFHFTPEVPV
ncbi:carboxymuconolactone decarboxylase family protein [Shewanella cyperi]|uniref:carboxymuconolactone decarboxylase family protein n=1 Tax=Shewanella cyperi TaxID=2814292 RepID=UPI001D180870|nr:carboxymuconolactone decarboxylase family protein [Shewanella cyperi]